MEDTAQDTAKPENSKGDAETPQGAAQKQEDVQKQEPQQDEAQPQEETSQQDTAQEDAQAVQKQDAAQSAQPECAADDVQKPKQDAIEHSAGKWRLVPLVSGQENEPAFVQKIKDSSKIILVYIVDAETLGNVKTAEVGEKMEKIQKLMADIKKQVSAASLTTAIEERIDWGNWAEKLANMASMEKIDEIVFCSSVLSQKLADQLRERGFAVVIA